MQPHRVVELFEQMGRKSTTDAADALHGHGPDLLGLGLGRSGKAARLGGSRTWKG